VVYVAVSCRSQLPRGRPIAFAGAGLPAAVADLLNDDVRTDDALDIAARGTGGWKAPRATAVSRYPSLIQLVGYWNCKLPYTGRAEVLITESAAVAGVQAARRRLGSFVHEPAPARLVRGGRTFPGQDGGR
jgi:hypothetical protein